MENYNESEYLNKRYELLNKFLNSEEKYQTNPIFHSIIESLISGTNVYDLIDKLINLNLELGEQLKKCVEENPNPLVVM